MTHFIKEEWILYKKNLLSEEDSIKMEEHLYTCDTCMDIFLSLIDCEDLNLAEEIIPSDFTQSVMEKIEGVIPIFKPRNKPIKKKKMMENIFMYYIAVASVVLVLTAGGVFTKMAEIPIENIKVDTTTPKGVEDIHDLTEKITNKTNNFIYNFGIKIEEETK